MKKLLIILSIIFLSCKSHKQTVKIVPPALIEYNNNSPKLGKRDTIIVQIATYDKPNVYCLTTYVKSDTAFENYEVNLQENSSVVYFSPYGKDRYYNNNELYRHTIYGTFEKLSKVKAGEYHDAIQAIINLIAIKEFELQHQKAGNDTATLLNKLKVK